MNKAVYIQYGSGPKAVNGWINFDASLTLKLQKVLPIKKFMGNKAIFDEDVRYGDIVKGLPVADNSVTGLYCSHILEHIHRDNIEVALENSYRILKPDGIFRLVVPDLFWRAQQYFDHARESEAADIFQKRLLLRSTKAPKGLESRLRAVFGLSMHQWMYDEALMTNLLQMAGFINVRRCNFGDCTDEFFSKVELKDRFIANGFRELAIECKKP